jgi:precorrin-6A synthase
MRNILVVGIGSGNPEHITIQAVNALNAADVLFVPTKGVAKAGLADVRRDIIERYVTNPATRTVEFAVPERRTADRSYNQSVDQWHAAIADIHGELIAGELNPGETGAFLVWGDPMLYDSTIRIMDRVKALGRVDFEFSVLPGITSLQSLCAAHKIPLNHVGKPVEITTGRRLGESFPGRIDTVAVLLDGEQAFSKVEDPDTIIYWGAYLGTPDEIVISGRLTEKSAEILERRKRAREEMGWIMDVYLLRKGADFDDA